MSLTWHVTEDNAKDNVSAEITGTVYDKLYARLSFNDNDVRAVYVDWGDGDNRLRDSKANYQWKTFDNPVSGAVIEHTYTATGADFTPIIQTINSEGFVSRYHMDGANPDSLELQPFTNNATITGMAMSDGQATGILRVENKTVKSGIDNSIFNVRGPQPLYVMVPPLTESSTLANIGNIILEITVVADDTMIATGTASTGVGGAGQSVQTITKTIEVADVTGGTQLNQIDSDDGLKGLVSQVLKVKWVNAKGFIGSHDSRSDDYTINASYKNVKIFLVTTDNNSTAYYYPVTYVSSGAPIKKANDPSRFITLDFSQSRAKASNVSNLQYRYDVGKVFFNPVYKWNAVTGSTTAYEFFGDNTLLSGSSTKNVSFAYNSTRRQGLNGQATITTPSIAFADNSSDKWILTNQVYRTNQFLIDDFGRFTDQYHLVRTSMQPASDTTGTGSEISSLIDNKPYVFRVTPAVTTGSVDQITKLDFNVDSGGVYTQDYTEAAFRNGPNGDLVSLAGMNSAGFKDIAGNDRTANEYLLLLFPKKTSKIFFNINNYAKDLISKNISGSSFDTPWEIAGVSYASVDNYNSISQDVYWKNVPFEDTTSVSLEYRDTSNKKYVQQKNDLSQSGYISFDMPTDWDSIKLKELCGGYFDDTTNIVNSASTQSIAVSGTCTAASFNADGTFGNYLDFELTDPVNLTNHFDSAEDVGAFKYIAYVSGTEGGSVAYSEKKPLWVVGEDGGNGANAALTHLYLLYGEDSSDGANSYTPSTLTTATKVILTIRRINVYDILNGASKVDKGSTAILLPPVDYDKVAATQAQTYVCSGGGTTALTSEFGTPLQSAWEDTSLYALKISLSGTVGTHTFPEIWNVFDASESHVQIIKEVDDSAYNLSAVGVTSDLSITRTGQYMTTVTKKGKVFIQKTGVGISSIGFTSIATGDTNSATAFADQGPTSMYGRLHMIRKLQAEGVPIYWDEVQKDGTYIRFWGVIQNLTENHATGGPTTIKSFNFEMVVTQVALIDFDGKLMSDIFPLGGIEDEPTYT